MAIDDQRKLLLEKNRNVSNYMKLIGCSERQAEALTLICMDRASALALRTSREIPELWFDLMRRLGDSLAEGKSVLVAIADLPRNMLELDHPNAGRVLAEKPAGSPEDPQ